ncbi:MAG: NAD(P)H-dependent oxidoreductase [Pseudomonadales bacterium]|jgi:FMN-dependent NADH-azoreductase|nr:NAD(P)H-dependent oxidoreductase [Pseudomonadales bacterium]
MNILHVTASARQEASLTRRISAALVGQLGASNVVHRDVAQQTPGLVDDAWVAANFTAPEARDEAMQARLAESDALVDELAAADVLVISAPIYNFGIPAALKAWIDMVGRVGRTFRYTSDGPVGLLEGKRAILVTASGGTGIGSDIDFATPYLRHFLAFVGIDDVEIVAAERGDEAGALARIGELTRSTHAAA